MIVSKWLVRQENPADFLEIERIQAEAFGPERFERTAFKIRDGIAQAKGLCFVGEQNGEIAGSVKLTPIMIGSTKSMLLGPLTVGNAYKGQGLGQLLLKTVAAEAQAKGVQSILLVGDHPYYGPHGYEQVPHGAITLPGPVDPDRLLILMLQDVPMPQGAVSGGYAKSPGFADSKRETVGQGDAMISFAVAT